MSFPKDQKIIESIKSATVAIGLMDLETNLIGIAGSGFIYDNRGYIMTAAHVLNPCVDLEKSLQQKGKKVETIALLSIVSEKNNKVMPFILNGRIRATKDSDQPKMPTPNVYDIALAKIKNNTNTEFPFLKIKEPYKIQISEEIAMCGFPRGPHSLSTITTELTGVRLSPPIQFGHVAALLPSDIAESPYAVQTDVIGTSGSSGSPLVDPNTGWVIGLAQNVIPSNFELKIDEVIRKNFNHKEKLEGEVSVGLVWGDACNRFYEIPELTKKGFEKADQQKLKTILTRFDGPLGPPIGPKISG